MKSLFLFIIFIGCFINSKAQNTFSNIHGQNNDLELFSNIVDTGDGFVLLLNDNNIDYEDDEYAIARNHFIKYNYSGEVVLENIHYEYDSLFGLINYINLMKTTFDDGFIIGCTIRKRDTTLTTDFYSYSQKAAIIKYDENLEKEWMVVVGEDWEDPSTQYIGNSVWQMPDSSFYLVGLRLKNSSLESMLIKVSAIGQLEWVHYIDALVNHESAHNIVISNDTIVITVQEFLSIEGVPINRMFMKLDLQGEVLEIVPTSNEGMHTSKGLALLSDNSISSVSILDDYRFRCDRYSWDLDTLWTDEFVLEPDIPNTFNYVGTVEDNNGDIITVGSSVNNDTGQFGFLRKYSIDGEIMWTRRYQYIDDQLAPQELYDVIATSDGGYAACGIVAASWAGIVADGWVIKVDSMGCLVPGCDSLNVSIDESYAVAPDKVWFTAGPNPVSKDRMLNIYCLGNDNQSKEKLKNPKFVLYNHQGIEIKSFEVEEFSMTYIMTFQGIASGNYILTLKDDTRIVQSEQIVVLN